MAWGLAAVVAVVPGPAPDPQGVLEAAPAPDSEGALEAVAVRLPAGAAAAAVVTRGGRDGRRI